MAEKQSNRILNLTGMVFGRLTVIGRAQSAGQKNTLWLCQCTCGKTHTVSTGNLRNGTIKSCGCLRLEVLHKRNTTHGKRKSLEYGPWTAMRKRCQNPKASNYHDYGGRGITVCERWEKFEHFLEDLGPRPSLLHSLERKDNDKGYEPGNVRWATRTDQNNNSRKNHQLTFQGQTMNATQWAKVTGLTFTIIARRLRLGWTVERTLSTPIHQPKIIVAHGKKLTVSQWAKQIGISPKLINTRLRNGFTPEQALSPITFHWASHPRTPLPP